MSKQSLKTIIAVVIIIIMCISKPATVNAQTPLTEADLNKKISALIKQMTLEEKVKMLHGNSSFTSAGVPRLGIPELVMSDGPHGVRTEHGRGWDEVKNVNDSGTYLPTGIALASTWNPALGYDYGKVLGSEAKYRGKNIILGPGINIMRPPLNGRNFEYQSDRVHTVHVDNSNSPLMTSEFLISFWIRRFAQVFFLSNTSASVIMALSDTCLQRLKST